MSASTAWAGDMVSIYMLFCFASIGRSRGPTLLMEMHGRRNCDNDASAIRVSIDESFSPIESSASLLNIAERGEKSKSTMGQPVLRYPPILHYLQYWTLRPPERIICSVSEEIYEQRVTYSAHPGYWRDSPG